MTAVVDDFLYQFVDGWGQLLQTAGLGVWQPTTGYTDDQVGIGNDAWPGDLQRAIVLHPYPLTDSPTLTSSTVGMQVKYRSPLMRDVQAFVASLDALTLGNYPIVLPSGVHVVTISSGPSVSLGPDPSERQQWARSLVCNCYRPTPHRR